MQEYVMPFIKKYFPFLIADIVCIVLLIGCLFVSNMQASSREILLHQQAQNIADIQSDIIMWESVIKSEIDDNISENNNSEKCVSVLNQLLDDTFGWDDYDAARRSVMTNYGLMDVSPYILTFFPSKDTPAFEPTNIDIQQIGYLNDTYDYLIYIEFGDVRNPAVLTCSMNEDGMISDMEVQ